MAHTIEMDDYIAFMEWFQNKYPDLYFFSWKTIKVPLHHGKEVTVIKEGMDAETHKAVIGAVAEYYQTKRT
jgi:hypothetical protein